MNHTDLIRFLANKIALTTLSVATLTVPVLVGLSSSSVKPLSATVAPSNPIIAQAKPDPKTDPTLKNLQEAYNGESNANVLYLAYAQKANEEGYKGVSSLFRAAARAEAIHRDNHAKVIQYLGATPKNNIATPVVKSTPDNLAQAIKGESYESITMYPDFIKQAKTDKNPKAIQTFTYALDAEAGHVILYKQAKNNLKDWKQVRPFSVCSVSGYTTLKTIENNCTVNGVKKPLEKVN
jgi:rubrerythrin